MYHDNSYIFKSYIFLRQISYNDWKWATFIIIKLSKILWDFAEYIKYTFSRDEAKWNWLQVNEKLIVIKNKHAISFSDRWNHEIT